jgi:hypothetical protein
MKFSIRWPRIHRAFASSQRKHLDHAACRPHWSFSVCPDHVSARRASGLGFVSQPSNPYDFVVNRSKPRELGVASTPIPLLTGMPCCHGSMLVLWSKPTKLRVQTPVVSRYPTLAPPWFWGSTKNPYPTSSCFSCHHGPRTWSRSAIGSIEPSLLVSTPWRPHMLRPFTPTLHLHQRKSSRNLYLQYSAKSQSTPCWQSLITPFIIAYMLDTRHSRNSQSTHTRWWLHQDSLFSGRW